MLAAFDYTGAAALVAAFGAVLASVFAFLNGRKANTIKADTTQIATAVTTANGNTLAELADQGEARRVDALPPPATSPPSA